MLEGDRARDAGRTGGELLLVANTSSGRGRATRWAARIVQALKSEGRAFREVDVLDVCAPRPLPNAAAAAPEEWWVFGGDGTLNGVLQCVADRRTRIALFPAGTGNVVARELGVPLHLQGALAVARNGPPRPFDLGRVNGRRFAFMVSAGFDAELVHWIAQRRRGPMRRIDWLVAVLACRRAAEPVFEVALDDGPRAPARYVAVYNCGLYAGGFRACPAARVDDGWFHVLTLREPIVPRFARVAWTILRGRAESLPDATLKAARRVRISGAARSQIDGDPGPAGDLDLAIEPAAVLLRGAPAGPARSAAEEDVLA